MERKDSGRPGGNGTGSGGSVPSFLGAPTDDDDISMFVQEIDARKPLASAVARQPLSIPSDVLSNKVPALAPSPGSLSRRGALEPLDATTSRPESVAASGSAGAGAALGLGLVAGEHPRRSSEGMGASDGESKQSSTSMGPMLTREAEVDEKLKHMHEVFLASLEGLGSGGSRAASGRSGSGSSSGVFGGDDSAPISRPSSREGGAGGLGSGFPSGLGRERRSGSLRSVSAMEVGRQAGLSDRVDIAGESPRRRLQYGE